MLAVLNDAVDALLAKAAFGSDDILARSITRRETTRCIATLQRCPRVWDNRGDYPKGH